MPLTTLTRCTQLVPNFSSDDNAVMTDILNASSEIICRYCNRDFVLTTYDELYHGPGHFNLLLNQFPVTQLLRVSFGETACMQAFMTDQDCTRASIRLDGDSSSPPLPQYVYLVSAKAGIETTVRIGPLTSATPTVVINGGSRRR